MTMTLLLTRPEAQSRALAREFESAAKVVIAPVLSIEPHGAEPDLARYRGVILTSANALRFVSDLSGVRVWCVGERTASAARKKGAHIVQVADDAEALIAGIDATGPLVHLRGEHARGEVADRLTSAGIETDIAVVYCQKEQDIGPKARALIEGEDALILPLFSPRSAALIGGQVGRVGSRVVTIAISPAVAQAWEGATGREATETCDRPTGAEMRQRLARRLRG